MPAGGLSGPRYGDDAGALLETLIASVPRAFGSARQRTQLSTGELGRATEVREQVHLGPCDRGEGAGASGAQIPKPGRQPPLLRGWERTPGLRLLRGYELPFTCSVQEATLCRTLIQRRGQPFLDLHCCFFDFRSLRPLLTLLKKIF